jgi:putative tricarboxylic transport membrane protein
MSAILGGQVTVGINGLAEFAPQIAAGTVRVLAISSGERLPGIEAPTLREQGVDVELENWRSLVAPPDISEGDRRRLEAAVEKMVQSDAWRETLARYRWNDRYLSGEAFARFSVEEEARVVSILAKLGTSAGATAPSAFGRYPIFVLTGLATTAAAFVIGLHGARRRRVRMPGGDPAVAGRDHLPTRRSAVLWVGIAVVLNLALMERAGFILASIPLFWLTARAFDQQHPWRDALFAVGLAVAAYVLFARFLQILLPAGVLARWL